MTRWPELNQELEALLAKGQLRRLRGSAPHRDAGYLRLDGQELLDFASNDYLGLRRIVWTADTAQAVLAARGYSEAEQQVVIQAFGQHGSGASRLVTGNDLVYALLERELQQLKGTEAALVFTSGYTANTGTISALMRQGDAVFSDQLNHASIIDGIRLSRAERFVYAHRDMNQLEDMLKVSRAKRKLIVTDAVFSMDGTLAPLPELVALREKYGAWLMLDEAHSSGVYGPHGAGLAHAFGLQDRVDVLMGTLSKAYGSLGGYVAGDGTLITYLVNAARSFIFTTGLPPSVVAVSLLNVIAAQDMDVERAQLHARAEQFRVTLENRGHDLANSKSQIVPLVVGQELRVLQLAEGFMRDGIAAIAIRPPSVPEGSARIRFALNATHSEEQMQVCLNAIIDRTSTAELRTA